MNKFGPPPPNNNNPMRIIEGIYWGIMWEINLAHQVATIIFLFFLLLSVSFSVAQREKWEISQLLHRKEGQFQQEFAFASLTR